MKNDNCILDNETVNKRPKFPKRAVITAGMPYGDKNLHFGHIGGCWVHSDTFARFLRDRIGRDNVIFVSGTDCYGSPILVTYARMVENGLFEGTLEDFVKSNHNKQKEALDKYFVEPNLFAASAFGDAKDIHSEICAEFFNILHKNGHLKKITTSQFYDTERDTFLNGRQVLGRCPVQGCQSAKAYADECELGHQYMPVELIAPKSVLTGNVPEMRDVTNWYFDLPKFRTLLSEWTARMSANPAFRRFTVSSIDEFLKPPEIYVKKEYLEDYEALKASLVPHKISVDEKKPSFTVIFDTLDDCDKACKILRASGIRFRTGKTLVPFRLTGNIEWGVPAPDCEGLENLTFWVWPESLFAPVSFTKTYLNSIGKDADEWKKWWCDKESAIYQFIGSDNISFYGPAEAGMWMGLQGENPVSEPADGDMVLPYIVANNHLLFMGTKASSSSDVKPPMAVELLDNYTPEQLRSHFLALGLGLKSVSFQPKIYNKNASESDSDPVLKEGNLLTNVLNRVARSCFYTVQTYYGGKLPFCEINKNIMLDAQTAVVDYEKLMAAHEFHSVMNVMDVFIRNINKYWAANMKLADSNNDEALRLQTLANAFHLLRTATVLMHPIAPAGTEMLREYMCFGEDFWSWERIFDTVYDFMDDVNNHTLKILEPRVDFFSKHPSQF